MQVAGLAAPALRLPEWVTTFVVFILLLGFPVALLLAWAYEVTPDGIKKTRDVPLASGVSRLSGRKLDFLVIGLLGIAVVFLLADRVGDDRFEPGLETQTSGNQPSAVISIAVLPFVNMSSDPEQEYFADGLTEEILNSLAAIDSLRVISRTSSFSFKNQNRPIDEIAAELGVGHILEGSVRRTGGRLRVTAQLIETSSDSHLWSETYDRELTVGNVLDIQENVAMTVANALHARLQPEVYGLLAVAGPKNLKALEHYYDGMDIVRKIQIDSLDFDDRSIFDSAVAAFGASIAEDPEWAPSQAGMGLVHHFWRHLNQEEQLRISRQYLMEALRLDENYGRAYDSLGYINTIEGDYDAAFESYDRARETGVDSPWGRAILLYRLARYNESTEAYRRAASKNPLSFPIKRQLIETLYCAERFRELIVAAEEMLRLRPDATSVKAFLAYAIVRTGNIEEGLRLANEVSAASGNDLRVMTVLAIAGQDERVRAAISSVAEAGDWWWESVPAAIVLDETDLALDILEKAESATPDEMWNVRCVPEIKSLAGNPRFDALMKRLDLAE
jgi:TolB-like protein